MPMQEQPALPGPDDPEQLVLLDLPDDVLHLIVQPLTPAQWEAARTFHATLARSDYITDRRVYERAGTANIASTCRRLRTICLSSITSYSINLVAPDLPPRIEFISTQLPSIAVLYLRLLRQDILLNAPEFDPLATLLPLSQLTSLSHLTLSGHTLNAQQARAFAHVLHQLPALRHLSIALFSPCEECYAPLLRTVAALASEGAYQPCLTPEAAGHAALPKSAEAAASDTAVVASDATAASSGAIAAAAAAASDAIAAAALDATAAAAVSGAIAAQVEEAAGASDAVVASGAAAAIFDTAAVAAASDAAEAAGASDAAASGAVAASGASAAMCNTEAAVAAAFDKAEAVASDTAAAAAASDAEAATPALKQSGYHSDTRRSTPPTLRSLKLHMCALTADHMHLLSSATALTSLVVDSNRFTAPAAQPLAALTNLRHLSISRNMLLGPAFWPTLGHLTELTSLQAGYCCLEGDGAECALASLSLLCDLELPGNAVGDSGAKAIGRCLPHLRYLDIAHNLLTARGVDALAPLTALERLNLRGMHALGRGATRALVGLTGLQDLDLSGNWLDAEDLRAVATLTGLRRLEVGDNDFGAGVSSALSILSVLPHVSVRGQIV